MMMLAIREETGGSYERSIIVQELDSENIRRAKEIFSDYRNRGVILNRSFDDTAWTLSNQKENIGLTMLVFEGGRAKKAMGWIGCDYCCYQNCVKAYLLFQLGTVALSSLQALSRTFNKLTMMSGQEAVRTDFPRHVMTLLKIIPGGGEDRDYVIQELEEREERASWKKTEGLPRQLADFKSYLRFHEVLTDFWKTADERQKLFYFPLYFWWNLTAILPLRPTEFLLTPRSCLVNQNGENILTVRRTKLKGGKGKIGYRIEHDYELKQYTITDNLAETLRYYLKLTGRMASTEIKTLFLQQPHLDYLGAPANPFSRYYTYAYLSTCLRMFYREIIEPHGHNIANIHLGDTRHLAMTNLIISGGSPVICRELAGHSDIDVSSHYYSNISNLVECLTLERYRKSKGQTGELTGEHKYPIAKPETALRVSGGYCGATSVIGGDISECLKVLGNQGHIGECGSCMHYRPDAHGIQFDFFDEKAGKQQVDADSRYLIQMIELTRKGIGATEDIGSALLRLQRSSDHYGKCLWKKYERTASGRWQDPRN
jgi:hypothetical protein